MERLGSAAAGRSALAGRASGGSAAARGRGQIRRQVRCGHEAGGQSRSGRGRGRQASAGKAEEANKKAPVTDPRFFEPVLPGRAYCIGVLPPPCSAIFELNGESPCLGSSTTTTVPTAARS